jgi:protein arginine kinase activator
MNCPLSGKPCHKPKLYHITDIIDGQVKSFELCEDCAANYLNPQEVQEIQSQETPTEEIQPQEQALKGVFDILMAFMNQSHPWVYGAKNKVCHTCGMSLSEVQSKGQLGCPQCYEVFGPELQYFFTKAQGGTEHVGKHPRQEESDLLATLEEFLDESIKKEDYEQAAALRDQIKELKESIE